MKRRTPARRGPSLRKVFARSEHMVGRRIAEEFVLVPLVGHGAQLDSIFNLNRVGTLIWQQLDGRRAGEEIVAALVERFDVDRATAAADYRRFLGKLISIGAVTLVADPR
jgi:hypothetical protein